MPKASSLLNKPRLIKKLKDFYDYVNKNDGKVGTKTRGIDLNFNNACNLRCKYCFTNSPKGDHVKEFLDYDAIAKLADQADELGYFEFDLQGGELDALKGAEKLFKAGRVKAILCELMFEKAYQGQASWIELASLIEDYGLRLFNIYQKHHYNGQIIQADLLFIHSSVLEKSKEKRTISFHKFSDILNSQSIQE